MNRRQFLSNATRQAGAALASGAFSRAALASSAASLAWLGCRKHESGRYTEADIAQLAAQRADERARSGHGPFGPQTYRGYRGLAELPWFELDERGVLRCVDDSIPPAIDTHCHFGMSLLFKPRLDLYARTPRVRHLLDCDATDPGCALDLDVYVNSNFDEPALEKLECDTISQGLWGSETVRTHTIPNLLDEMDASRVERALILPIAFNFPFGDDLTERWHEAIAASKTSERLIAGASVHPRDPDKIARLEAFAAQGARVVKLHPTMQAFYPDEPDAMAIYEAAERLGLAIFFHGGRAGIEPESRHRYAMPRHYGGALSGFPKVQFVLGHAGARDGADMLDLGLQHANAWFCIHGQGVTHLDQMIRRTGGERMLFGTDWPFYHLAASLAKVLIVTQDPGRHPIREAILRGNAERLLA